MSNGVTDGKGRPLGVCVAIVTIWSIARIGLSSTQHTRPVLQNESRTVQAIDYASNARPITAMRKRYEAPAKLAKSSKTHGILPTKSSWNFGYQGDVRHIEFVRSLSLAASDVVLENVTSASQSNPLQTGWPLILPPTPKTPHPRRLGIYAYSFWRTGLPEGSAAPAAQYGGSQSGLIATYQLTAADQPELAALIRVAATPGKSADQEIALGLRWRPVRSLPVTVSAERRLRTNSPDQFALYVAGSSQKILLLGGTTGRGFAQAGVVPGKKPNLFYDAGFRVDRKIATISDSNIAVGAGIWTGGQRGASRVDVGPAIRSDIAIGALHIDIAADWRFRIGGNASPRNGPALTLSAGF